MNQKVSQEERLDLMTKALVGLHPKVGLVTVKVKKLYSQAKLPTRSSEGAACFDVYSLISDEIWANEVSMIGTGLAFEVPPGFELEIRPRSGLSLKGLSIVNSPGTLDSDYRGELFIPVRFTPKAHSRGCFIIKPGDRIAQVKVNKVLPVVFEEVEFLEDTVRGTGGFGSTGR